MDINPTDAISPGGIVYVLTNDAMPNMIKIGMTLRESVEQRVTELSRQTAVPLPFKVAVARAVDDARRVEQALHVAFGPDRVNPRREFFNISPVRAIAIINAIPGQDLTPGTEEAVEKALEAADPAIMAASRDFQRKRRPPLNFFEMQIPLGSLLVHIESGETATVVEPRRVSFREETMGLTRAQKLVTNAEYNVAPASHWLFNGLPVSKYYDDTYPMVEPDE